MKSALMLLLKTAPAILLLCLTAACKPGGGKLLPEDPLIREASEIAPSVRQMAWQETEFNMFIHFFRPREVDAEQWARVCRDAGMKMIVLTCKHHGGFCLWPSDYTDQSVKNVKWKDGKGDIVREVSDACRKYGLKFGIYLSPWDMHEPSYGTSAYDEFFKNQLRELLSHYGEVSEVWFDGYYGGPPDEKQKYDWEGYYKVVRDLAPGAVIAITGPDVRWVGTESGYGRETEWSVVGVRSGAFHEFADEFSNITAKNDDLGSREVLRQAGQMIWYPSEVDVSIRPSWGYRSSEDTLVHPVEKLLDIYYSSVGRNSVLLLNFPPDSRTGRIHETDIRHVMQLRKVLDLTFGINLATESKLKPLKGTHTNPDHLPEHLIDGDKLTWWSPGKETADAHLQFEFPEERTFNRILLQEFIRRGQRVEDFSVEAWIDGRWKEVGRWTTIGYKRILRTGDFCTRRIRLHINAARNVPMISEFGLYFEPPLDEILGKNQ